MVTFRHSGRHPSIPGTTRHVGLGLGVRQPDRYSRVVQRPDLMCHVIYTSAPASVSPTVTF